MSDFRMPALGADMTEGTLLEWLVKPGDTVHRGDVVAVVDTDKAAIDVEVFDDGVVQRLVVEPGTKVPVGSVLAEIGTAAASSPPPTEPAVESPPVRHLAHVRGVDLTGVSGTGPGGSITRHDVEAATAPARRWVRA